MLSNTDQPAHQNEWLCAGLFDPHKEIARLGKQQEKLQGEIAGMDGRLANQSFVDKAPAKVLLIWMCP